mmetsp:Transcript_45544/g.74211  ORF Transcript_45544/g.74211 Transcript_45544/m.74211 type:complete len:259 (-) Transcript_45544:375-1151(-)|eukprot:CAMPEP_0184644510 /NCGR_PEP_ID=MMETSP0308-20130426/1221_1 /TAXON_ID=38269 /ORGANISM="Gloeochaete witrockiana, Strain SAG 46.84" /LENGTH=258 /DNA_ID=CAMNT_0027073083 /DNA_START=112 /DNA_END=885 /DNA_ORIENTATION=-
MTCYCGRTVNETPQCAHHGSVGPYGRHVLLSDARPAASWPSHVESERNSDASLMKEALKRGAEKLSGKAKLGLIYSSESAVAGKTNVLLLPDAVRFSVPSNQESVDAFVSNVLSQSRLDQSSLQSSWEAKPVSPRNVLVCIHNSRDKRCGEKGPSILEALQKSLPTEVNAYGCSHIGGHAHAGNVIVYPIGDWFGLVDASDTATVSALVKYASSLPLAESASSAVTPPKELLPFWRGRMNIAEAEQGDTLKKWCSIEW